MNATALAVVDTTGDPMTVPEDRRDALELALAARAPSTRRAYGVAVRRIADWLEGRPLEDRTLAEHVFALAGEGLAPATIGLAVSGICFMERACGRPSPSGTMTQDALRVVRREHTDRGRGQARAVSAEQITEIVAIARRDGRHEDAAIAGLLFLAALRRSECAALEWRDVEPATDLPGALRIRVRRKKTDQLGEQTDIRIVKNGAAESLVAIRPDDVAPTDRVFRLNGQSIGRRFTAAANAAGIEGVTAHSGRVGHASELTRLGASTTEVMLSGGWKSPAMVAHYAAGARAEAGAVAKYL